MNKNIEKFLRSKEKTFSFKIVLSPRCRAHNRKNEAKGQLCPMSAIGVISNVEMEVVKKFMVDVLNYAFAPLHCTLVEKDLFSNSLKDFDNKQCTVR